MEIRRKVFSLLQDENGEERYYSTNEFENFIENEENEEKLFSTGDDELDDLLEEVYYSGIEDGYDYAQREYAQASQDIKDYRSRKGAGKTYLMGGVAGSIGRKAGIKEAEKASKQGRTYEEQEKIGGKRAARVAAGTTAGAYGVAAGLGASALAIANKKNPRVLKEVAKNFKGPKGVALGAGIAAGVGAHVLGSAIAAKRGAKESIRDAQLNKYRAEERVGK